MKVRIKDDHWSTAAMFSLGFATKGKVYQVICVNTEDYNTDHVIIIDDAGEEMHVFHDEYEVVE